MRTYLLLRSVLFVALVAPVALASDEDATLSVRPVLLSEHPADATHRIYVKGQVVTTLRFWKSVDPGRTKMLGWEGRLEPLAVVRNKVLLEPLHDLDDDEGLPLVVTLVDGTEVPFLLRPPGRKAGAWVDQQVDVFESRDSYAAMHAVLRDALQKNSVLEEENERYRKEETSEDHALAALLASGAVAQTPFTISDHFSGKDEETHVDATVYQGKGKVAVVFKIRNLDPEQPWRMKTARLVTRNSGHERTVAVRSTVREIAPGGSGVVALVVDGGAFVEEGGLTSLFLELYRHDGLRQAFVQLDPSLLTR